MKLEHITIHNFRGIIHQSFNTYDYTLLVGANNSGKSTVIDAIRAFYEKDGFKYDSNRDSPRIPSTDNESWIELEFKLNDNEYESIADIYKNNLKKLKVIKYFVTGPLATAQAFY